MLTKIWRDIDNKKLQPVYLLIGEEAYLIDETVRKLKQALAADEEAEVMTYSLDEVPVDEVLNEADTIPFFTEKKLVIAKNASLFKASERDKEKITHDIKRFEQYMNNPAPFSIVVFIAPYEKLDERKKFTKIAKANACVVEAVTPEERDLAVWITSRVEALGKSIDEDAIGALLNLVGANMLQLNLEIEKLALYLGSELEITETLVHELVAKTLEQDAFKMVDAYFANDEATALEIYHDLLLQKQEPIMLVGLLASTVRLMNHTYYLQSKGYNQQQIAKQLKAHPYRIKMLLQKRNRPTEEQLLRALYALSKVDEALKTSSGNRERPLELFIMKAM